MDKLQTHSRSRLDTSPALELQACIALALELEMEMEQGVEEAARDSVWIWTRSSQPVLLRTKKNQTAETEARSCLLLKNAH